MFESNKNVLKRKKENASVKYKENEICPLYVFLPPWHHYGIITGLGLTLDMLRLLVSYSGLRVMHSGPRLPLHSLEKRVGIT